VIILTNKLDGLKITCIGQLLSDGSGVAGSARFKNMINLFKEIGMEINLISFSFWGENFHIKRQKHENMNVTSFEVPKHLPRFLRMLIIIPVFLVAFKYSKKSDILFSDFITEVAYVPTVVMGKLFNKPIIIDYIDKNFFKYNNFLRKRFAQKANLIFAISYYLKKSAENDLDCNEVVYLPNFIDVNLFRSETKIRQSKRKELKITDNDIVIGYAGAPGYNEGFHVLIEAYKNLKLQFPTLKLLFMGKVIVEGETDIRDFLDDELLEGEDILILPSQPYEKVPEFLSACDILCCPKIDSEINRAANPVKVVEYLSMDLPTVSSSVGGIIDTIDDCENGFLVVPENVKSLENKLKWILLNPKRAKIIAKKGRESVVEKFSFESSKKVIIDHIHALINKNVINE